MIALTARRFRQALCRVHDARGGSRRKCATRQSYCCRPDFSVYTFGQRVLEFGPCAATPAGRACLRGGCGRRCGERWRVCAVVGVLLGDGSCGECVSVIRQLGPKTLPGGRVTCQTKI
jgi:hypothetical protein